MGAVSSAARTSWFKLILKKTIYTSRWFAVIIKTHPCFIRDWSINLFFLQFGLDGKKKGGEKEASNFLVFFFFLIFSTGQDCERERKKERKAERKKRGESCHFKPLSLAVKLLS